MKRKYNEFRKAVYGHYARKGRRLPWRETGDPYRIFVSEIMLQQTQVSRVLKKYPLFIREFPAVEALAKAPLRRVMGVWQGLGYNRRALALRKAAGIIVSRHAGKIPSDRQLLKDLPGVGEATSGAVCAFAFNQPVIFIETNIRSAYLHHFFPGKNDVSDDELALHLELTLDAKNPRKWYNALMDYGVYLKENNPNPSRKSSRYRKQGGFEGSDRQLRGRMLSYLLKDRRLNERQLCRKTGSSLKKCKALLISLCKEGLVRNKGGVYSI